MLVSRSLRLFAVKSFSMAAVNVSIDTVNATRVSQYSATKLRQSENKILFFFVCLVLLEYSVELCRNYSSSHVGSQKNSLFNKNKTL